ncbi:MAG: hypothetical protein WD229_14820 [Pirellulales bacterium]
MQAWSSVILVPVAILGFGATLLALAQNRNRQEIEIEGYIRVDAGPETGTDDYDIPIDIVFRSTTEIHAFGEQDDQHETAVAWYRNLQTHPLGIVYGIVGRLSGHATTPDGHVFAIEQQQRIAYLEPGRCVQLGVVRFPRNWEVEIRVDAVQYRNANWDGRTPEHGRTEYRYENGQSMMVPWSNPRDVLRDRIARRNPFRTDKFV